MLTKAVECFKKVRDSPYKTTAEFHLKVVRYLTSTENSVTDRLSTTTEQELITLISQCLSKEHSLVKQAQELSENLIERIRAADENEADFLEKAVYKRLAELDTSGG